MLALEEESGLAVIFTLTFTTYTDFGFNTNGGIFNLSPVNETNDDFKEESIVLLLELVMSMTDHK